MLPQVRLILLFLLSQIIASPLLAGETGGRTKGTADEIIQSCQLPSQKGWDSGVSSKMKEATSDYIECLQTEISNILYADLPQSEATQALENLNESASGVGTAYYLMYSQRKECLPTCGTMWSQIAMSNHAGVLENFLREAIQMRTLE